MEKIARSALEMYSTSNASRSQSLVYAYAYSELFFGGDAALDEHVLEHGDGVVLLSHRLDLLARPVAARKHNCECNTRHNVSVRRTRTRTRTRSLVHVMYCTAEIDQSDCEKRSLYDLHSDTTQTGDKEQLTCCPDRTCCVRSSGTSPSPLRSARAPTGSRPPRSAWPRAPTARPFRPPKCLQ